MSKTAKSLPDPLDPDNFVYGSSEWERALIDSFLRVALSRIELTLTDHRALAMKYRDNRLAGMIEYFRHQKSTVEDLIFQNNPRPKRESPTRSRRRTDPKS